MTEERAAESTVVEGARRYNPQVSPSERKPLLAVIDGHGIIHRAYHALKDKPLTVRRTGEHVSAVFGFTNTLLSVIDDLKPTHLVVALDLPGPTFRHARDEIGRAACRERGEI